MRNKIISSLQATLTLLLIFATIFTQAQKINNIQTISLLAPEKVKIDGKFNEWNDTFQAYNKTTKIWYTLSNDDKNLYLVVKSTDAINNTKILGGGVTITINTAGKKKEENAYSVTFPILSRANMRGMRRPRGADQNTIQDSASLAEAAAARKLVISSIKEISVIGFKDITDTLISIYNEYGIKAAANYDQNANLLFELAIPLKLMNISIDNPKEFAYNLKINGIQYGRGNGGGDRNGGRGEPVSVVTTDGGGAFSGGGRFGGGGGIMEELLSATDFWAKYTLAKK